MNTSDFGEFNKYLNYIYYPTLQATKFKTAHRRKDGKDGGFSSFILADSCRLNAKRLYSYRYFLS